jgi:hypothetical protein
MASFASLNFSYFCFFRLGRRFIAGAAVSIVESAENLRRHGAVDDVCAWTLLMLLMLQDSNKLLCDGVGLDRIVCSDTFRKRPCELIRFSMRLSISHYNTYVETVRARR